MRKLLSPHNYNIVICFIHNLVKIPSDGETWKCKCTVQLEWNLTFPLLDKLTCPLNFLYDGHGCMLHNAWRSTDAINGRRRTKKDCNVGHLTLRVRWPINNSLLPVNFIMRDVIWHRKHRQGSIEPGIIPQDLYVVLKVKVHDTEIPVRLVL